MVEGGVRKAVLFLQKKNQKDSDESGQWACTASRPMSQSQKSFCAAFFKKRLL
jgi:hypothetical protein